MIDIDLLIFYSVFVITILLLIMSNLALKIINEKLDFQYREILELRHLEVELKELKEENKKIKKTNIQLTNELGKLSPFS